MPIFGSQIPAEIQRIVAQQIGEATVAQQMQIMAQQSQTSTYNTYFNSFITNSVCSGTTFATINTTTNAMQGVVTFPQIYQGCEIDQDEYMNNQAYYDLARQRGIQFRIRTAEETRIRNENLARLQREAEERQRKLDEAKGKAKELLLSNLTAEQRKTYEQNKWFIVQGGKTKTKYRIRADYSITGNIEVLDRKDKKVATLCCHCSHEIPNDDQFLSQAIALKYDEDNFLKIANRRWA